jgi:hypothetical protein
MVLMCYVKNKNKKSEKIIFMHFQAKDTLEKHPAPQCQTP